MVNNKLLDFSKIKFELRKTMRLNDVGDYFDHTVVAYDTGDPVINNAILLHEFIEYTLVTSAGIDWELIDQFDTQPDSRKKYPREYRLYRRFHYLADKIERQFIENLGLNWQNHEEMVDGSKETLKESLENKE